MLFEVVKSMEILDIQLNLRIPCQYFNSFNDDCLQITQPK